MPASSPLPRSDPGLWWAGTILDIVIFLRDQPLRFNEVLHDFAIWFQLLDQAAFHTVEDLLCRRV